MEEQNKYNEDEIIDYDATVSNDGEPLATLPENDEVEYVVTGVDKGHNKDNKPMLTIKLDATSLTGNGKAAIKDYIVMTRKSEWKLCELYLSLGLRQHGEAMRVRLDIAGMTGRARVSLEEWVGRDGDKRYNNKIKNYLEPSGDVSNADAPSFG